MSQPVVEKLNYITEVEEKYFTVSTAHVLKENFIRDVESNTFEIKDVDTGVQDDNGANIILPKVLHLKNVPAAALTNSLGDLTKVPTITLSNGTTTSNTVVDNINNIYNILTWGDMPEPPIEG